MRRVQLLRTAFAASLLSALTLAAAPAQAGGPTSAILSVPGAGTTSSLYYTDPEYDELAGLVGVDQPSGTFEGTESGAHEHGAGVTITWLIHDVSPWRVDRVYLGGKGGPWIATQVGGAEAIWESPVLWHHPEDGARLTALLDDLGLGTAASQDPDFDGVAGEPVLEQREGRRTPYVPPLRDDPGRRVDVVEPGRLGTGRPGGRCAADPRVDETAYGARRRTARVPRRLRRLHRGAGPLT